MKTTAAVAHMAKTRTRADGLTSLVTFGWVTLTVSLSAYGCGSSEGPSAQSVIVSGGSAASSSEQGAIGTGGSGTSSSEGDAVGTGGHRTSSSDESAISASGGKTSSSKGRTNGAGGSETSSSAGDGVSLGGSEASPAGGSAVDSGGVVVTGGSTGRASSAGGETGGSKGSTQTGGQSTVTPATGGRTTGQSKAATGGAGVGGGTSSAASTAKGGTGAGSVTGSGGGTASSSEAKSSGCGLDSTDDATITVNGAAATYILNLPKGYDKNRAYPIMFCFHGAGVAPSMFLTYFNMPSAVGADAIVVTPTTVGDQSAWDEKRDLPLFDALLEKMQSRYCIDNNRIFAGGHSSGGMFTNAVGCKRGNVVRAIATLSAMKPSGTCTGEVAVWISHGTADAAINVSNGRANRDFWVGRNGCDATQSTPVSPSPTVEYGGCSAGLPVRYCEYDGDHYLPSYAPQGIWDFFKSL